MRVIVLQGMPNTGKTKTLWLVRDLILSNGVQSEPNAFFIFGQYKIPHKDDFKDIIQYKGKRIAFYSTGDYSTYLADAIYDYDRLGCDVLVCALSINTAKIRANNALNHFNATRINKTVAPNTNAELATNTADAQTIFNLI